MIDLQRRGLHELVATRMKLLTGSVLTNYCTQEERDEWKRQADEITAELNRRSEAK
jgi:hypothetical protein